MTLVFKLNKKSNFFKKRFHVTPRAGRGETMSDELDETAAHILFATSVLAQE